MMISNFGGGGNYYGGGSSGGMDPTGGSGGMLATLNAMLAGLPGWLSITIKALLLLLAAAFIGWLVGQIVGRILYPNPEKPSMLNKKQKFIVLGAVTAAFVMVVFALRPTPPKTELPAGNTSGITEPGEPDSAEPEEPGAEEPGTDGSEPGEGDADTAGGESSTVSETPAGDAASSTGGSTTAVPEISPRPALR